jgi:hypothetical protein
VSPGAAGLSQAIDRQKLRRLQDSGISRLFDLSQRLKSRKTRMMSGTSSAKTRFTILPGHDEKANHFQTVNKIKGRLFGGRF